jgi:predicted DNA-binding transcriptional regulator AlpA
MLSGMATIMNATDTARYLGISRSTLWAWVRAGKFPQPSKPLSPGGPRGSIGGSTGGWYKSHVDKWSAVRANRAMLLAAHARRDAAQAARRPA